MIRSKISQRTVERALCALVSEPTVKAAARSARVSEKTLLGWLACPPFRSRYNQYRKAVNAMRAAMGYPEVPAINELQ